jgi:dienelactone hydrolase
MSFSHGGRLTLDALTVWAKETFAPLGQPGFRAFLSFYPPCNIVYPERERIAAPLRIHTGELDDWTPAAPCFTSRFISCTGPAWILSACCKLR